MNKIIKWGILAPGGIAQKFAADLAYSDTSEIVAIGSRSLERAQQFGANYHVPHCYGSYEEVARDPEVDIIYVATPHTEHYDNVKTCLEAGKSVLCEKPFTINARQARELIELARERKLFLMEAMWVRYLPAMVKVRQWLDEGHIGEVRLVKADYGINLPFDPAHRLFNPELGGGALLDVGIYPLSFASMVYGCRPERIASTVRIGTTGVDEQASLLLSYPNGRTAVLNTATQLHTPHEAYVVGTQGSIVIPVFPSGRQARLIVNHEMIESFEDDGPGRGSRYEAEEAVRCLQMGLLESPIMPLDETLALMETMDRIRADWNVQYAADSD